jgi:cardiolipin synthase
MKAPMQQEPPLVLTRLIVALTAAGVLLMAAAARAQQSPTPEATSADPAQVDPALADLAPGRIPESALSAVYNDGVLGLRFGGPGERISALARWPIDEVPQGSHAYRAARLELVDGTAADDRALESAEPMPVHGRAEWDVVVTQVMTNLAPAGESEAALTLVQGQAIVFQVTRERQLRVYPHEDKPADMLVTRTVGEAEFAAQAEAVLRSRFPGQDTLLFHSGDDPDEQSFVFFDLAHRQSVLIAATPIDDRGDVENLLRMLVRLPDTLILRGHALGFLTRPVSSVTRLVWLVSQSALKLVPPRYIGYDSPPPPLASRQPMDLVAWEKELDTMNLPARQRGSIAPLIDGEAFFTELVQALQDAQQSVSVRLFIFDNDDYAMRIADLLKRRSHEVRVRVLIDALGTLGAGQGAPQGAATGGHAFAIARYLRSGSEVEVRETPNPWLVADHTKTILVDRRVAYLGGMNIGYEYRHDWHDMMVELRGPIVGRLQYDFDVAWAYAGIGGDLAYVKALGEKEKFQGDAEDPTYVDLRPLYTRTLDPQVLRAQLAAIRRSKSAIWVEQPYVSDDSLIAALIAARARGVDVRLIVPTRGDSRFMNSANLLAASVLVRNGVRVYVYPGMTHVKAALYDGWACLGSANFDKLSLRINRETNVATSDPLFVDRLRRELFDVDFARSRELVEPPSAGWGTYVSAYVASQL